MPPSISSCGPVTLTRLQLASPAANLEATSGCPRDLESIEAFGDTLSRHSAAYAADPRKITRDKTVARPNVHREPARVVQHDCLIHAQSACGGHRIAHWRRQRKSEACTTAL